MPMPMSAEHTAAAFEGGNKEELMPWTPREKGVSSSCPLHIIKFVVEEHNHM